MTGSALTLGVEMEAGRGWGWQCGGYRGWQCGGYLSLSGERDLESGLRQLALALLTLLRDGCRSLGFTTCPSDRGGERNEREEGKERRMEGRKEGRKEGEETREMTKRNRKEKSSKRKANHHHVR